MNGMNKLKFIDTFGEVCDGMIDDISHGSFGQDDWIDCVNHSNKERNVNLIIFIYKLIALN